MTEKQQPISHKREASSDSEINVVDDDVPMDGGGDVEEGECSCSGDDRKSDSCPPSDPTPFGLQRYLDAYQRRSMREERSPLKSSTAFGSSSGDGGLNKRIKSSPQLVPAGASPAGAAGPAPLRQQNLAFDQNHRLTSHFPPPLDFSASFAGLPSIRETPPPTASYDFSASFCGGSNGLFAAPSTGAIYEYLLQLHLLRQSVYGSAVANPVDSIAGLQALFGAASAIPLAVNSQQNQSPSPPRASPPGSSSGAKAVSIQTPVIRQRNVDAHFERALGETWKKLKDLNSSSTDDN